MTDKEANELAIELGKRQGQIILDYESLPKIHGWVYVFDDGYALDYELSDAAETLEKAGFKSGDRVELLIRKITK